MKKSYKNTKQDLTLIKRRRNVNNHPTRHGVSLVELLIFIALFGVISIFLAVIVMTNSRLFNDQKTNTYLATQNQLALDEMVNQVREAQDFATCPTPICPIQEISNTLQLVLSLWPLDPITGDPYQPVPASPVYDYMVYKWDSSTKGLTKYTYTIGAPSKRIANQDIIAKDVTNFTLSYNVYPLAPATSQVTIYLENQTSSLRKTFNFNQTAKAILRNK